MGVLVTTACLPVVKVCSRVTAWPWFRALRVEEWEMTPVATSWAMGMLYTLHSLHPYSPLPVSSGR